MKNIFEKIRKYYSGISVSCVLLLTLLLSLHFIEPEGLNNLNTQYLQISGITSNIESNPSNIAILKNKYSHKHETQEQYFKSATKQKDVGNETINSKSSISTKSQKPADPCIQECSNLHRLSPEKIDFCVKCCRRNSGNICLER